MQKELNASGVAVEPTEFDEAMEDLVEYFENQEATAEIEKEAKLENIDCQKQKAEDVRLKAVDSFRSFRRLKKEKIRREKNRANVRIRSSELRQ